MKNYLSSVAYIFLVLLFLETPISICLLFSVPLPLFFLSLYLSGRVILFYNNIQLGFRSVAFDYSLFPYVFFYLMKSICYSVTV